MPSLIPDSSSTPLLPHRWRPAGLLIFNLLALMLLASWLWEPAHAFWDRFDDSLFVHLNAPLAQSHGEAMLWALMNVRLMDVVSALLMALLVMRGGFIFNAGQVRAALFTLLSLAVIAGIARTLLDFGLVRPLHLRQMSPSLTSQHAVRLSQLFPDWIIPVKDSSVRSFPGDHAAFALLWALLLSFFARGWRLIAVWLLTVLVLMPRLVAGAHAGSDDFVGGLFIALMAIGWGCYTPYAATMQLWLEKLTRPLREALAQRPRLRNLSVMH